MNRAVLAIWNNIEPEAESEFNSWYVEQHLPERVGIPGFIDGMRYKAIDAKREYLTVYRIDDVETLRSAAYLERLNNPTQWTRKIMPFFNDMVRSACNVVLHSGTERGGFIGTIDFTPKAGQEFETGLWLEGVLIPHLMELTWICNIEVWKTDSEVTDQKTAERAMREKDCSFGWVFVMKADSLEELSNIARFASGAFAEHASISSFGDVGTYRYINGISQDALVAMGGAI